ncbi:MAG: hypothetical protein JW958_04865 [Candidatus Eisenbacteria bacterium]|nr:hypothetical protein [Candidatus Eisenbacteria bacterium]
MSPFSNSRAFLTAATLLLFVGWAYADIHGVVREAEGDPIPGIVVSHGDEADTTDSGGEYLLYGATTGVRLRGGASWGGIKALFRGSGTRKARTVVEDTLHFQSPAATYWEAAVPFSYPLGSDTTFHAFLPASCYSPPGVPWSGVEITAAQAQQIWDVDPGSGQDVELYSKDDLPRNVDGTFTGIPADEALVQETADLQNTQTGINFFQLGPVDWPNYTPDGVYWWHNESSNFVQDYHSNGFLTGAEIFTTAGTFSINNDRAKELNYRAVSYGGGSYEGPDAGIFTPGADDYTAFNAAHIRVLYMLGFAKEDGINHIKLSQYVP